MKAKTKTKKNVRKLGRLKYPPKDKEERPTSPEDIEDLSLLRKPIDTSLTSLRQIVKLFDTGSDEVKSILDYECDIIYECRICRNLTRSFASFLSHKRVYCQTKFDVTFDKDAYNHSSINSCEANEESSSVDQETKENNKNERTTRSQTTKEPCKKDLTSVVEMLQKKRKEDEDNLNTPIRIMADTEQIYLEVMHSNRVAYQSVIEPEITKIDSHDLMKAQATEIQNILGRDTAVLGPDGHLIEVNSFDKVTRPKPIFSKIEDTNNSSISTNLTCSMCNSKFSSKKTLTFHMKSLHTPHRMVFPCPLCTSLFTNPWGVYRHLFKVHRKTNEQVRKMRNQIQEKAFKTSTTRAQDIENDCAAEKLNNSLINDDNQINETEEWMAHLESDGDFQQCGGCGKRFDRKAALLSHSQICQKRIAACTDASIRATRQRQKAAAAAEVVIETSTTSPINTSSTLAISNNNNNINNINNNNNNNNNDNSISVKDIISSMLPQKNQKIKSPTFIDKDDLTNLPNIANLSSSVTITRLKQESINDSSINVEGIETYSKDSWEKIHDLKKLNNNKDELAIISVKKEVKEEVTIAPIKAKLNDIKKEIKKENITDGDDDPEVVFTKIENTIKNSSANSTVTGSRKRKLRKCTVASSTPVNSAPAETNKRSKTPQLNRPPERSTTSDDEGPVSDRVSAIERRIATIADLNKLLCLLCNTKFSNMVHLRRHMVIHINWNRYRCRICDFKCFDRRDAVTHCNKSHQTRNNKSAIENMLEELKPDNDLPEISKNNPQNGDDKLEIIDKSKSSDEPNVSTDKIECKENGTKNHHSGSDDENYGLSDSEENDIYSLSKRSKLDEDPELRRMVMEVIFGSTIVDESQDDKTSPSKLINEESPNNRSSSSSPTITESNSSSNDLSKSSDSIKSDDHSIRPSRNRSKVIKKDFIYDLDTVLNNEKISGCKLSSSSSPLSNNNLSSAKITPIKKSDDDSMDIMNYFKGKNIPEITKTDIIVCNK